MSKNYYAVIMAWGVGSRFWPVSTPDNPKQFHDMLGTGQSLIKQTFNRLAKLIPAEQILIATNQRYKDLVLQHLPGISENQLLLEPAMRNTAPCILYSALKIAAQNEEAVMIVAPSDHYIEDEEEFVKNVKSAFEACEKNDLLMTLGITPSGPNTGFGYIQFEDSEREIKKVKNFTEKPDLKTAEKFLSQGDYVWNAGIFIWSVKSILKSFKGSLPGMYDLFQGGATCWNSEGESDFIADHYPSAENISIDYGIMEKADNVYVLISDFGWSDLGTWGSLYEQLGKDTHKNSVTGKHVFMYESSGNIVNVQDDKLVVLQGLEDYIVVQNDNIVLVCRREDEQKIKQFVNEIRTEIGDEMM